MRYNVLSSGIPMADIPLQADWFYIGHYGQLGPLTFEQMAELIEGGVIARETYVWKSGMNDWLPADKAGDLSKAFSAADPFLAPPPPPGSAPPRPIAPRPAAAPVQFQSAYPAFGSGLRSDKSRILAGLLNFIPGVGRIYLGYSAIGVLQLVVFVCSFGIGGFWAWIDAVIILSGGVRMDGYGRQLTD